VPTHLPAPDDHRVIAAAPPPRVAVCVATYRRPTMLREMLESLAALRFAGGAPELRIVVVDNDAEGSARPVVDAARPALRVPVRYEVEPRRNIAHARNLSVAAAIEDGAEWIAFVDDDETARPDWLDVLLRVQARYGADVVCGAVRARLAQGAAPWIERTELLGSRPQRTGTPLSIGYTSNVLVAARLLAGPAPFDPAFGITGGSDSHLFLRLHRQGARMVWAEEAVVDETMPASRVGAAWLLRRAFRVGNCALWAERALGAEMGRPAMRALKASARLALGVAQLAPGALRGRVGLVRALHNVSYGTGALAAVLGYRYEEYRTVHGE
jgi:succinoglycan biosynthesis protein ExoM